MKTWEAREHENNLSHYSNNFEARSIGREIRKPNCEAQSIDNNNNRFEYDNKVSNIVFLLLTMMERGKMPFRTV